MPSDDGSREPLPDPFHMELDPETRAQLFESLAQMRRGETTPALTRDEEDRLADGEPYCFRCGKPASSFSEYGDFIGTKGSIAGDRAAYVRNEEGTYNPDTNRFACDECYIAIGTPSGPNGWRAP